jgi:hypothetical protein
METMEWRYGRIKALGERMLNGSGKPQELRAPVASEVS